MRMCFGIGLYKQGLLHDLSKYSWTEFSRGCRYFQGNRSPNNYEREIYGYSVSWLHHKGRNKHHFEYWLDYNEHKKGEVKGMPMPRRYIAEMYCDRVAACKTYQKGDYTELSPIRYFYKGSGKELMHPETRRDIGFLLTMLGEKGERRTAKYIKNEYLKGREIPKDYKELESLEAFDAAQDGGRKKSRAAEDGGKKQNLAVEDGCRKKSIAVEDGCRADGFGADRRGESDA